MSVDYCIQLKLKCVDWAVLRVFEDKLQRILTACRDMDDRALLIELECVREWMPTDHPRWLGFEVEQQLQVLPEQFMIAQQLQRNPGSVIQLNMGLGKVRLICSLHCLGQFWVVKPHFLRNNPRLEL